MNHQQDQIVGGRKSFSSSAAAARFIMFCRAEMKCRGREGGRVQGGGLTARRLDSHHKRPQVEISWNRRLVRRV